MIGWDTKLLKNYLNLVKIRSAPEKRVADEHLGYEAADRPNIYDLGVPWLEQNELRGPIPSGDDSHGEIQVVNFFEVSSQTEISNLEDSVFGEEKVPSFDISMHDALFMQISHSFDELLD